MSTRDDRSRVPPNLDPDGHDARRPSEIPARGLKQVGKRLIAEVSDDRLLLVSAGITFFLLLAMVPALTALVSIYGLVADPASVREQMGLIEGLLPGGARDVLSEQLTRLSEQANTRLGLALALSIVLALWSANAGVKGMFEGMNVAYDEKEQRGFLRLTFVSLTFTVGLIALIVAALGVSVVLPLALERLGLGGGGSLAAQVGGIALLALVAFTVLAALYRWGPSRRPAQWQWITPGALIAGALGIIASGLFSWYVANFGSYDKTYGSLGAIIGFMTWAWIMVVCVMLGAEINAEMEHQTAADTTRGATRPMGSRGARMADTVAREDSGTGAGSVPESS